MLTISLSYDYLSKKINHVLIRFNIIRFLDGNLYREFVYRIAILLNYNAAQV
jgi:hypothetical protein